MISIDLVIASCLAILAEYEHGLERKREAVRKKLRGKRRWIIGPKHNAKSIEKAVFLEALNGFWELHGWRYYAVIEDVYRIARYLKRQGHTTMTLDSNQMSVLSKFMYKEI